MNRLTIAALAASLLGASAAPAGKPHSLRTRAAPSTLELKQSGRSPASSQALFSRLNTNDAVLSSAESGTGYAVDIQFGSATFTVLFDTGSSDLWLPASDFQCVNEAHAPQPLSSCRFDQTVSGGFSKGEIADQNFNITYGDGEFLTGKLGYETVSLAGVTVPQQEVALVDYGYWNGDSATDGLMGFAYPSLTSAYTGSNSQADNSNANAANYPPFFFNAVQQGLIDGLFTMTLAHADSSTAGQLILGGAPTTGADGNPLTFATTPLRAIQLNSIQKTASQFSYYTIIPDGFSLGPPGSSSSSSGSSGTGSEKTTAGGTSTTAPAPAASSSTSDDNGSSTTLDHFGDLARQHLDAAIAGLLSVINLVPGAPTPDDLLSSPSPSTPSTRDVSTTSSANFTSTQPPLIVDSGTTLTYLPTPLVRQLAGAFSPAATYNSNTGVWETSCDASGIPSFSIRIAGTDFPFAPQELLLTDAVGRDAKTGKCLLGVQGAGEKGPYILGDTFLRGKVVVFDVGGSEMRFAMA